MKKPCSTCTHPTSRYDGLCPNCYNLKLDSDCPQSYLEEAVIHHFAFQCECGESRPRALILMCRGGNFLQGGPPRTKLPKPRDTRATNVYVDPSKWFGLCYNCYVDSTHRSPGRPKKYTDAESKERRISYPKAYKKRITEKLLMAYGTEGKPAICMSCPLPATRVLYVGEFGKAPNSSRYWSCRLLALKETYWRLQFLPYCDNHEVSNIGQRNHEARRRAQAQSLADLQEDARRFEAMLTLKGD